MMFAVNANTVTLVVAVVAAATAIISLPLGHALQGRRERRQWIADRRVDAYAALATASSDLASATGILGGVLAQAPEIPMQFVQQAQDNWTASHERFGAAQYRAVLIAEVTLAVHIERMSQVAFEMTAVMQEARPTIDTDTWQVTSRGDPTAIERLDALGDQAIDLRNVFIRLSRCELGTAAKETRFSRLRRRR